MIKRTARFVHLLRSFVGKSCLIHMALQLNSHVTTGGQWNDFHLLTTCTREMTMNKFHLNKLIIIVPIISKQSKVLRFCVV